MRPCHSQRPYDCWPKVSSVARRHRKRTTTATSSKGVSRRRRAKTSREGVKTVPPLPPYAPTFGHGSACLCATLTGARARCGYFGAGGPLEPHVLGPGAAGRADQLVRAALSVSSNIAEACGRGTVTEFRRFLIYARGSAQETLTQLRVAAALDPTNARAFHALEKQGSPGAEDARAPDRPPAAGPLTTLCLRPCATPLCYVFVLRL